MKQFLIFFSLFIAFTANAQVDIAQPEIVSDTIVETTVTDETEIDSIPTAADNPNNSLLWKISGNDLTAPSYLYGTIHIIAEDDFFLTDATKTAFEETEQVTFEIDLEKMNNILGQFSMLMDLFMKDKMTLKKLLSEEDYALVKNHFAEQGMGGMFGMLEKMKPMFTSQMASMDMSGGNPMAGGGMGDGMVSYEMEFMEMAKKDKKKVQGLETAAYQMSIFDSIPYKIQAEMLVEAVKGGSDAGTEEMDMMVEMYKSQDIESMAALINSEDSGFGGYEDLLLDGRNRNWIPVMEKQMAKKTTFFAVGAAHLAGDQGVINLLRNVGYTLEPMK